MVVPVAAAHNIYATKVQNLLHTNGLWSEVDTGPDTLNKKIRNGETASYNYIFVVGSKEMEDTTVNVRNVREEKKDGKGVIWKLNDIVAALVALKDSRKLDQTLSL